MTNSTTANTPRAATHGDGVRAGERSAGEIAAKRFASRLLDGVMIGRVMRKHENHSVAELDERDRVSEYPEQEVEEARDSDTLSTAAPPFISVIVPVRNEAAFLAGTINQLAAQDYPGDRFEILVVDGRSTDATRAIAEALAASYPNLRVLDNPQRLSSAARNIGITHSRGDIILIVDGHCELDGRDYLRNVAGAFQRSGADCLGRPQPLDVTRASPLQGAIAAARSSWLGHHPDSFIYSADEQFVPAKSVAVAYRRSVFDRVGMFDESFDACEDVELNHRIDRMGLRCYFTPSAQVRYFPRSTLRGLFRQMVRYGRGRVRLLRKHPETFSLGGFIPAVWLAGLFLGPLACCVWPPLWRVYAGVLALYGMAVAAASAQIALRRREPGLMVRLPATFATIHAGAGWGAIAEGLRFRPSA